MSALDACTDSCGWVAAFVAALAYGSFGVPIKHTKSVDVHPFVFQTYKTVVMFLSCWCVKFLGEEISFTPWGLLTGLMWVIGGAGGIYGIRMAGLAVAVGTWASIMVMINFFFGILVFEEPVDDVWATLCSFLLLIVGLIGMSNYSSPQKIRQSTFRETESLEESSGERYSNYQTLDAHDDEPATEDRREEGEAEAEEEERNSNIAFFNGKISITKRQCGIMGAAMNGIMTGGSLIPLHYAAEEGFGGAKYFPSMGIGAMIANTVLWLLFYAFRFGRAILRDQSVKETFYEMPRWHFRVLWFPALIAGLLLSLAMFSTIIAITYLGQGVGNSIVQSKILVSGLWGIFWYKEVVGAKTIAKWFASAGICMISIIWLSYERLEARDDKN